MSDQHAENGDYGQDASGDRADDPADWLATSTLRIGLAAIGIVLLLFALGRAVGVDLLRILGDALATRVGRWLVVAFFALLLILVAVRGFDSAAE